MSLSIRREREGIRWLDTVLTLKRSGLRRAVERTALKRAIMWVGDQKLMVAIKRAASTRPPLLLFNGIGANWELAGPFLDALDRHHCDYF